MPGLLQTEGRARALFAQHCPPLSEETIDQHTEARLSRQKLLTRVPLAELSLPDWWGGPAKSGGRRGSHAA
ncbi:Scr1 family TA system antitoxin-like transcriptional regulator [Streptomyces sp. NPDC046915]|uniref:Scr1 family TA system antitoxin-like transcriptional regulator n=1 Tax=Streptomyces sp. NPDC046915 TaxID=3155257 RepID=UPI0033E1CC62